MLSNTLTETLIHKPHVLSETFKLYLLSVLAHIVYLHRHLLKDVVAVFPNMFFHILVVDQFFDVLCPSLLDGCALLNNELFSLCIFCFVTVFLCMLLFLDGFPWLRWLSRLRRCWEAFLLCRRFFCGWG